MKLSINDRTGLLNTQLRHMAERRLLFALSRFDSRIRRAELMLSDENGPRGGIDKSVRLEIQLQGASNIIVTDRGEELGACISRAFARAARAVARTIDRKRTLIRSNRDAGAQQIET